MVLKKNEHARIKIHLELDPLYVHSEGEKRRFTLATQNRGPNPIRSAFSNLWAWGAVGAGALATGLGAGLMVSTQSSYNQLSAQSRDFSDMDSHGGSQKHIA